MRLPRASILALALLVGLGGCALMPHRTRMVQVRPAPATLGAQVERDEGFYQDAAAAISRRDYARALELLQAARARKADDVRVLNAFAVVYDKLGRFDLSARYYVQAQALDPQSAVLRNNLAYSLALQGRSADLAAPSALAQLDVLAPAPPAPPAPVPEIRQASIGGMVRMSDGALMLQLPVQLAAAETKPPGLTGHPLTVVDASGRRDRAERVRVRLASMGWSARRLAPPAPLVQAESTIRYAPASLAAAKALARTLPASVRLTACDRDCDGLHLIVGSDAANWKLIAPRGAGPRRHS